MRRNSVFSARPRSLATVAVALAALAFNGGCSGDATDSPSPATGGPNGRSDAATSPAPTGADASVDTSTQTPPATNDAAGPLADAGPTTDATAPLGDAALPACTGANKICLVLKVPPSVVPANVVKLYIGFSKTAGGFPEIGKGTTLQPVTMVPGTVMPFTIDNKGLSGDYFVNVGLYMQGGGAAAPKAGVDFSASTSHAQALSSAPTALDEMMVLELAH